MHIEHISIWTDDLERLRRFYEVYFRAVSNEKYTNSAKGFSSYFLSFLSGARLEIMQLEGMEKRNSSPERQTIGFAHMAFSIGSKEAGNILTNLLRKDGYSILDGPRTTGDGYYESVVLDPDGNRIEITI